jgi:hypothetical protein
MGETCGGRLKPAFLAKDPSCQNKLESSSIIQLICHMLAFWNKQTVRTPLRRGWAWLPLALLLAAGCRRDDVKVYQTAKESSPPPGQSADAPNPALPPGHPDIPAMPESSATAMPGTGASQPSWKTPEGWTEQAPGQMRVGSFKITGANGKQADVSIIPLGGIAGGVVANVNRWRGQLGLEPASADDIKQLAQSAEVAGQPAESYELAGKNPGSGAPSGILAAIAQRGDTIWFFKMTGDLEVIAAQKPAFAEFLKSVRFAPAEMTGMPPGHPPMPGMTMPAGHPDVSAPPAMPADAAAAPATGGKPGWQVPAGWQAVPGGQFLVAKFNVPGDGGAAAAVNISASAGDGGGLAANVNRWRKQLGLAEQTDAEISGTVTALDLPGGKAAIVEMAGTDAKTGRPTRVFGAMVPQGDQTWFYKLTGDGNVVQAQKDAFIKFVQSAKY